METTYYPNLVTDIVAASSKHVERPAMVIEETTYTYRQLFERVWSIQQRLFGVGNDIVGIVAGNDLETYASILAVLMTGKTYVVLHPDYPEERNRRIALLAGIGLLLHSKRMNTSWLPQGVERICTSRIKPRGQMPPFYFIAADKPAYIIFTSGSTGEPKGVPISYCNLDAFYAAYRRLEWNLGETDRMLQMFELTFDVSVVSFLYPLTLGACIYTVPQGGMKYLNVLDIMERHRLTFAAVAPSVLRLSRGYFSEIRLPELRYLIVTAEATDVSLLAEFRPCIPNATVVNLYGPTEATIYCTSYTVPVEGGKHHNGMAAIGKPFSDMTVVITDEAGNILPAGKTGELWISGPQVMQGYWNAPEKSGECFVQTTDRKLFYRTGDLCQMDNEGDLIYCGRKDTQIKIQGFRVELGEIEYCAKAFYQQACNAIVLPVYGEGGTCELHLVVERDEADEGHGLEFYLQRHLPPYMQPRCIHFLPRFPLNGSNKTDKKKILELIQKL